MPVIRKAEKDDLDTVLGLENSCFTDPWTPAMFAEALESRYFEELYLLEEDEKALGYVCFRSFEDEGEIMSLCVDPGRRKKGYGKYLLAFALDTMEKRGAKKIFLEVRSSNVPAITLYSGAGFELIGKRRDYYRRPTEDALVYKKTFI